VIAIYIHWPFCKSKCPYCDFNSHVAEKINYVDWQSAYLREIEYFSSYLHNKKIASIYFGGGTPTLMPPFIAGAIIEKLRSKASFTDDIEITLEGNPTSTEVAKLKDFKSFGVNRVSLGVQALNDSDLKFLGREHSASEAKKAVEKAAGVFSNYSFDLIYARPQQTIAAWQTELEEAMSFAANHISLYQLTIEKGTKFYTDYVQGKFAMPDDELAADFYQLTNDLQKNYLWKWV